MSRTLKSKFKKRKPIDGQISLVTKVPVYTKYTQEDMAKRRAEFAFTNEDRELQRRLNSLNEQIKLLKIEQRGVVLEVKKRKELRYRKAMHPVVLYALRLENNCWYVGATHNVNRRFSKHMRGKGAVWTGLHKPIEIAETRITAEYHQDKTAKLEDDMTLEYAMKYGGDKVRGGGYCQVKPRWPTLITENDNPYRS